jgi:hypothetical protein
MCVYRASKGGGREVIRGEIPRLRKLFLYCLIESLFVKMFTIYLYARDE